jgi:hypothetical protein
LSTEPAELSDAQRIQDAIGAFGAVIRGIDPERKWIEQARAKAIGLPQSFSYSNGREEALQFPDDSFDLVTCQTVLIHIAEPEIAILWEPFSATCCSYSLEAITSDNFTYRAQNGHAGA